jgi:hypothetical protein
MRPDWPPLRCGSKSDQKWLERKLNEALDAHWKQIVKEDGVTEEQHARQEARDARQNALARAAYGDIEPLKKFVEKAAGPDGKALGKAIAEYVQLSKRKKSEKLPKDYWHEAMSTPRLKKLTEAAWEADRARDILRSRYGRTPTGYEHRTDLLVAAARSKVSIEEIMNWKKDRRCPDDPWRVGPIDLVATMRDAARRAAPRKRSGPR